MRVQWNRISKKCLMDTTKPILIPNNDLAKVMYYLDCVCYCIDYKDRHIHRYTNYTKSGLLSAKEVAAVFELALTLSPDQLIGRVFYPNNVLKCDAEGRFYQVAQVRGQLNLMASIVVAGRTCQIQNILAFQEPWLTEYYLDPMNRLAQQMRSPRKRRQNSCSIS